MANDFRSARFWAAELIGPALCEGSRAVDATMGNGHDTQWLCERVGETGRVYAFDIQPEAVAHTRQRLEMSGLSARAVLFCDGHEHMANRVTEPVDVIMFNLGWLPGSPHAVTTLTRTTLEAAGAGLSLLRDGGLMTLCIYPGHEEGRRELEALMRWATQLNPGRYDAMIQGYLNQFNDPPRLIAVRKRQKQTKVL